MSAFLSGFSDSSSDGRRKGSRSSAADCYFIMAAASANQSSYESQLIEGSASADHGLFTYCLLEGCGYNCLSHSLVDAGADVNANGVITFLEGFSFASDMQESIIEDWNNDPLDPNDYRQNAQLYPADCGWFGLLRR